MRAISDREARGQRPGGPPEQGGRPSRVNFGNGVRGRNIYRLYINRLPETQLRDQNDECPYRSARHAHICVSTFPSPGRAAGARARQGVVGACFKMFSSMYTSCLCPPYRAPWSTHALQRLRPPVSLSPRIPLNFISHPIQRSKDASICIVRYLYLPMESYECWPLVSCPRTRLWSLFEPKIGLCLPPLRLRDGHFYYLTIACCTTPGNRIAHALAPRLGGAHRRRLRMRGGRQAPLHDAPSIPHGRREIHPHRSGGNIQLPRLDVAV